MPAQLISHYRILGPLGSGGMGVVYRAEDTTLHRPVALKFITEPRIHRAKANEKLRREARAASALNHPNICTIYEVGEDAGEMFIAMEYVEGRTLADLIRQGPLPVETLLRFGCQVSAALAHAHEQGVVHGDLKPANIIVTPRGEAKILDFGLARQNDPAEFARKTLETATSEVGLGGTFPYMAPEQIEGSDSSARTDIWSFGVVLYEMVARQRPFQGENLFLLCNSILRDPPRALPPQVLPGLATVISRCLEKEPERRYHLAGEARAALEALAPTLERVPAQLPVPHRTTKLGGILAGLALFVLVVVAALAIHGNWFWRPNARPVPSRVLLGILPPIGTGDASQLAFDNGLADTLNSRLGELSVRHPFGVIPMNSTGEQRVNTVDAARQQFGVNLVLILNVQRAAGLIRVNYSLVDANSHEQVRSGTVTAAEADPFALQDQVFESVAASMDLQLAPQEKQALTFHGTTQPAAYDFYVQGRGYLQDYVVPEKVDNAITLFGRALEKDPSYAEATAGLGEAYWRKYQLTHEPKWADAAILNCQKAADQNSNLASAHTCLGRAFSATGDYEKSASQYRRALKLDAARDDAYDGLAAAYAQLDRSAEAEQLYKQAISVRPEYWANYNRLGLFYMAHAHYEEASSMFSQVVSLAPDSFTGYYNLGAVRVLQGKYDDAIPLLERSLGIRPTGDAFTNLGTALFQMRRYPEAAAKFEQAVKLDEKDYILWGNLADAYYWTPGSRAQAAGAYEKAIALANQHRRVNPHDAPLLGYLAEYHVMRGDRKLALTNLEACLRLQPNSPDMLLNAGIVYQQLGETNRALDALERAVSLGLSPELLRDTPNFDSLHDNLRFTKLIQNARKN
jgi:tetratricopeptide (TPR) repeat protein/TolB-like protein/predicted Ser/Thr protein kinase